MLHKFPIIFCITLSITLVATRPQDILGEVDDYQYGIDISKLEDELIDQAAVVDDKLFLQHLLSKWKTSTTTTDYPVEESSTETTTTTTTTPETTTTTTTTTEPTTTSTTTTTTEDTTTTASTATPATFFSDLTNKRNQINPIPISVYPAPVYQQPTFSYYPVSNYNIPPPAQQIPQMPQIVSGMQGISHFPAMPQAIGGLHAIPQMAAIPQIPQTMLAMSGISHIPAFNPYAQYHTQFISPVYNPYRFKK